VVQSGANWSVAKPSLIYGIFQGILQFWVPELLLLLFGKCLFRASGTQISQIKNREFISPQQGNCKILFVFSVIYGEKIDRRYLRGIALTCKPNPVIKG
jgi:hypothetical protein